MRRPRWWMVVLLTAVTLLIVGPGVGYLIWHAIANPPNTSIRPSPSPTATPFRTPLPGAAGLASCPVATPSGQHRLGTPGPPRAGQRIDVALDFCGRGSAIVPPGTTLLRTGPQWGLGVAVSCPTGSAGADGQGVVLSITEVLPDGSRGIDSNVQQGDWTDRTTATMFSAGSYKLRVVAVSPFCVWHIAMYPT